MPNLKRTVLCQMLLLCTLVLMPLPALAGLIAVTPAGGSSFTLQASGFNAPAGFHLTVNYDSTSYTNPRVVQGSLASGGMFAANTNFTGSLQLAVISTTPLKGSGPIATITFDPIGATAGAVTVTGYVINTASAYLPVTFGGWSPSGGGTDPNAVASTNTTTSTANTTTTTSGGVGGAPFVVGGTLTMPSDDSGAREHRDAAGQPQTAPLEPRENIASAPVPAGAAVAPEPPPAAKKPQAEPPRPVQSVLEKFRLFAGERTPKNLVALFDRDQGAAFSQSPAICLADGKSSVRIVITKVSGDKAPNFSFNHAVYLSLQPAGDGEWQVEVRPDKGALRASVSMLSDGAQQEIPLTVAPPVDIDLDKSGAVNEANFQLFLKTRGTEGAPRFDLNGDGKRDYQDDYIYTANYLAMKAMQDKKDSHPQKDAP